VKSSLYKIKTKIARAIITVFAITKDSAPIRRIIAWVKQNANDRRYWTEVHHTTVVHPRGYRINLNTPQAELDLCIRSLSELGTKPTFMDVGAAGGLKKNWRLAVEQGLVNIQAFDLNDKWPHNGNWRLRNLALGDIDAETDFYVTAHAGCCSCKEPNFDILKSFPIKPFFEIETKKTIQLNRFDSVVKKGMCIVPDILKIDIQGFEYECLVGFGEFLQQLLCIELEGHFQPIYKGQKLIHEVIEFLNQRDFALRNMKHTEVAFGESFVEVDCFFSRKPQNEKERNILRLWEILQDIRPPAYLHRDEKFREIPKPILSD